MEEYVKHFLELKKRDIADITYYCLQYRAKHISEYFREVNIKDIETKDINSFLDHLLRNGNNAIGKNVDAGSSAEYTFSWIESILRFNSCSRGTGCQTDSKMGGAL